MVTLELALEVWTGFVTTLSEWFGMGSTLLLAVAGITFIIYACSFVGAGVCAHVRDAVVRGREVRAVRAMPAPVLSWEAKPQPAASTEATPSWEAKPQPATAVPLEGLNAPTGVVAAA